MTEKSILVVDDEPLNLKLLARILGSSGFAVYLLTDSYRAVEVARQLQPDLILLDINMPGWDGFTVCRALKADADLGSIPVIFLSIRSQIDDILKAFDAGGVDYITKPFQIKEVIARVETHLGLSARQAETERLRAAERAYFEQINQLKDDLLSTASHDIKSPISAILTSVYALRHSGQLDVRRLEDLDRIERETRKIHTLVTDLLDFARTEAVVTSSKEPVSLNDFLRQQTDDCAFAADSKCIALTLTLPDEPLIIPIFPGRLGQAIHNLLSNAIKYTPEGGQVAVTLSRHEDGALVRIRDNGIGIPPEDLPRIFERFYRVQQPQHLREKGSGLGMAIVQSVVNQHNGSIHIDSEPGSGTTITLYLPG